jgi:RNA polymerase sigma-70 factor, ECF subfamily
MASRSENRFGLLAAGFIRRPVIASSTPEASDDANLVTAAQAGDRAAFGRLYERYARMVHGVLLAKVPLGDVDDLLQDVFLKALRQLSTLRQRGSFGAWLAAIARNLANDYHRRALPKEPLLDDTPNEVLTGEGNHAENKDRATAILNVIRSLPEAYRETLILRLVEGFNGPEIAARTGMTHGSVRVNLHRGMEQLRARLSRVASSDGPEKETR